MSVTQDYKILTIADRAVISFALAFREDHVKGLIEQMKGMKGEPAMDRLLTSFKTELEQLKTARRKVLV